MNPILYINEDTEDDSPQAKRSPYIKKSILDDLIVAIDDYLEKDEQVWRTDRPGYEGRHLTAVEESSIAEKKLRELLDEYKKEYCKHEDFDY